MAVGLATVLVVVVAQGLRWWDPLETGLTAWRFRHADQFAPAPASDAITIFAIDDGALATWGEWSDWPRERLASVIELLMALGARTIVLDVRFETQRDAMGDRALAEAMRRHGDVVLAVGASPPVEPIGSAASAFGSVAFDDSSGSMLLEVPTRSGFGDAAQLGLMAAARYRGVAADIEAGEMLVPWIDRHGVGAVGTTAWNTSLPTITIGVPIRLAEEIGLLEELVSGLLEREVHWPIDDATLLDARGEGLFLRNELGEAALAKQLASAPTDNEGRRERAAAKLVGAFDRLDDRWMSSRRSGVSELQRLDALVRDRLVFIGWTATGAIADFVPTPLGVRTPGVVVHAQIASGELTGFHKRRFPGAGASLVLTALLGALGVSAGCLAPKRAALLGAVLLGGFALLSAYVLFDLLGLLTPMAAPMAACAAGLIGAASVRATTSHRERLAIRQQFRARIDPKLAERLERDPRSIKLAGELREITVVFTDLSGYTAFAERRPAAEVVKLLNTLQTTVAQAIIEHGGYINKFLGDGIMAIWGAPDGAPDHAELACAAVLEARRAVDRQVRAMADVSLALRAGVASGSAIVGDCGAPPRLHDYTAIGDVVNIAARLEDIGPAIGVPLLMTQATARALSTTGHARARCLGPMQLPGREQIVRVFQLCEGAGAAEQQLEAAIALFEQGAFAQGAQAWRDVGQMEPALMQLAALYAQRCDALSNDPTQVQALVVNRV